MGVTALPSSPLPPREAAATAASRTACASRRRLDPVRLGRSTTAMAATKKESKRPGSLCDNEPPMKRHRTGAEHVGAAVRGKAAMSSAKKDGVNRRLDSLLPLVRSPHEVISLPNSVHSVFQVKGTRRSCAADLVDDQIEININALRTIKNRGGAHLRGRTLRLREEEAHSQSKPRRIILKAAASKSNSPRAAPKSILPKAVSKSILPKAAAKSIPPRAAAPESMSIPLRDASMSSPSKSATKIIGQSKPRCIPMRAAASKSNTPSAALKSILPKAGSKSIRLLRATPTSILLKAESKSIAPRAAAPKSIPPGPAPTSNLSKASSSKSYPVTTVPSILAPPKPSQSRKSLSELARTAISQSLLTSIPSKAATLKCIPGSLPVPSNPSHSRETVSQFVKTDIGQSPTMSTPPAAAPSLKEPPKSMKELLADAKKAMMEIVRQREILKLRAAARWEVEHMVRTVEFNDPYIDYTDAFK